VPTIFSPRTPAIVERNGLARCDGSTARERRYESIDLPGLQRHDDANVFAVRAMDDSKRSGEDDEADRRDPRKLSWCDMIGHQ
jgi:hypothetical protein